tara:strand:+ start:177 stop:716 length:540 start_codon:yes stop_codon:yes gene_type:complete
VILGLDISTSITGATLVDDVGQVLYCEAWDMRNKKYFPDLYNKANFVKDRLLDLRGMYLIEHIFIEQSLQAFRPGFSSAKTLLTLASFNGIVSYICQDQFGIKPEYIGASTARKSNGVKVPRGEKAKKVVLQYVLDNEPGFVIEYTKQGNPKPDSYDRADSLIIARAGYNLWKEKNSNS